MVWTSKKVGGKVGGKKPPVQQAKLRARSGKVTVKGKLGGKVGAKK